MEPVLAAIGLAVAVLLLLRMAVGERLRRRADAVALRSWHALHRTALSVWHWRASRRAAAEAAQAAIRRARSAEHLKVVPKSPRDTLH